jgi:brefeldin A-resistance guanine nucleotide exchange factor 1
MDVIVHSFDFGKLSFDVAIRVTLESFRLPGEAQKIDRIMEAFSHAYFENCAPEHKANFANEDAAFVLAFSLIMLNTNQHSNQLLDRDRMTLEGFLNHS